jgi:hypothetical protein
VECLGQSPWMLIALLLTCRTRNTRVHHLTFPQYPLSDTSGGGGQVGVRRFFGIPSVIKEVDSYGRHPHRQKHDQVHVIIVHFSLPYLRTG